MKVRHLKRRRALRFPPLRPFDFYQPLPPTARQEVIGDWLVITGLTCGGRQLVTVRR